MQGRSQRRDAWSCHEEVRDGHVLEATTLYERSMLGCGCVLCGSRAELKAECTFFSLRFAT